MCIAYGSLEDFLGDGLVGEGGNHCRVVDDVCNVAGNEAFGHFREFLDVDGLCVEGSSLEMDEEHLLACFLVGERD